MKLQSMWLTHKRWVVITVLGFTALCLIAICLTCRVISSFSPFWVANLGVCQEIGLDGKPNGISDTFSPDSERIYAFFILDSKIPVRLKVRWYYEDQLFSEEEDLFQPGLNYSWISSQNGFRKGSYRVGVAGQIIQFKIEKSDDGDVAWLSSSLDYNPTVT